VLFDDLLRVGLDPNFKFSFCVAQTRINPLKTFGPKAERTLLRTIDCEERVKRVVIITKSQAVARIADRIASQKIIVV